MTTYKSPDSDGFTTESSYAFKELIPMPFKLFHKIEAGSILPDAFHEACVTVKLTSETPK